MSLTLSALRMCMVLGLKNRTLAGPFVQDSEIAPLDENRTEQRPEIVVYTDDFEYDPPVQLHENCGELKMTIATLVTARMRSSDGIDGFQIPFTDAGMELQIDWICRQIEAAFSDPENEWIEFFKSFAPIWRIESSRRAASARDGLRLAGRELTLSIRPVRDPMPGAELPQLWLDLLEAMESQADDADALAWALIVRQAFAAHTPRDQNDALRALFGSTAAGGDALLTTSSAEVPISDISANVGQA